MSTFAKVAAWILTVGLAVTGAQINWGPDLSDVPGVAWIWHGQTGKLDKVVAVYESRNQPVAEASVMAGVTVQAIDKAGKWRQYDKDKIPQALKPALDTVVASLGIPCVCLFRGGSVVASAKFPASDADLSTYIQKNGGF